jgi:hypothetical protein
MITCVIFLYEENLFKIWQCSQVGILEALKQIANDEDFGEDPTLYDLKLVKEGIGKSVKYKITASPPKALDETIKNRIPLLKYDLNEIFNNGYPANTFPFEKTN